GQAIDLERLIVGQSTERRLRIVGAGRQRVGQLEQLLFEERHLDVGVRVVEGDGVGQGLARHRNAAASGEVRLQVVSEFVQQDEKFAIGRGEREAGGVQVDHRRAGLRERVERRLDRIQYRLRRTDIGEASQADARYANARTAQPVRIEILRVVGGNRRT